MKGWWNLKFKVTSVQKVIITSVFMQFQVERPEIIHSTEKNDTT